MQTAECKNKTKRICTHNTLLAVKWKCGTFILIYPRNLCKWLSAKTKQICTHSILLAIKCKHGTLILVYSQQPKSETLQAYLNPVLAKLGLWSNQLQVIKAKQKNLATTQAFLSVKNYLQKQQTKTKVFKHIFVSKHVCTIKTNQQTQTTTLKAEKENKNKRQNNVRVCLHCAVCGHCFYPLFRTT